MKKIIMLMTIAMISLEIMAQTSKNPPPPPPPPPPPIEQQELPPPPPPPPPIESIEIPPPPPPPPTKASKKKVQFVSPVIVKEKE